MHASRVQLATLVNISNVSFSTKGIFKYPLHIEDVLYWDAPFSTLNISLTCNENQTCTIIAKDIIWRSINCYGKCYVAAYGLPKEEIPYSMQNSEYCRTWFQIIISNLVRTICHVLLWNLFIFIIRVYDNSIKLLNVVKFEHLKTKNNHGRSYKYLICAIDLKSNEAKLKSVELLTKQLCSLVNPNQINQARIQWFQNIVTSMYEFDVYLPDPIVSIIYDFTYGNQTLSKIIRSIKNKKNANKSQDHLRYTKNGYPKRKAKKRHSKKKWKKNNPQYPNQLQQQI